MPMMPKRATRLPGHRRARQQQRNDLTTKVYDTHWRKLSRAFLTENPWCVACEARGVVTASRHTDHIHPIQTHPHLKLDATNWQALCVSCHSQKTMRERHAQQAPESPWELESELQQPSPDQPL